MNKKSNQSKLIFVDFNGVISYNLFWFSFRKNQPELFDQIQAFLFEKNKTMVSDWMVGKYTTEEIIDFTAKHTNIDKDLLLSSFVEDCKNLDISEKILNKLISLKDKYKLILRTDNMDCFTRFTVPNNKILSETFDEIYNSYELKSTKDEQTGFHFIDIAKQYGVPISDCIIIDDSKTTCTFFETLGGKAYCLSGEEVIVEALSKF